MSMLTPYGMCLSWDPALLWLNAVSDALIGAAFFATALFLAILVWRRRRELQFAAAFVGFGVYIMACGFIHVMSVVTLWIPAFGLESGIKILVAVMSIVNAVALLLIVLPRLLVAPTRIQLQQAYAALEAETRQRQSAEAMVRRFQEIEASEAQVRQAQKMEAIGQLTGGVAHDFNNILTVITGTIEILADAVKDQPALVQITNLIGSAASRGADLTRHLLAFARRQPLQPRSVDVNALVIDTARLLRPTLGEQIEIESMLAHDCAPAMIDPGQLSTAILNLALNARDAMPAGGKLTLETRNVSLDENYARMNPEVTPGAYVMVAVSDSGEGIPTDLMDKVFDPFFTTKDVGKGVGLGLSMVYGFVKQSDGHIKIYSEQGHGTSVKLYLPQAGGSAETPVADAGAVPVAHGGETVLIVEDDALVREYVVTQIGRLGYATLSARNASEALELVDGAARIDLLFTDVIIPGGMNGRQLAIEAMKRRPGLRVLYTSGYTENAIVHHGRLDPGVLLLPKPYVSADLARMLRTALAG